MKSAIVGMLTETPVHPGAGQSAGFVDLPVARESSTKYPVVVGSSLKGALRELARENKWADGEKLRVFGGEDKNGKSRAGGLLVGDARLLLLPVRSLNGSYKWLTCPHLIERYQRDRRRSGYGTANLNAQFQHLQSGGAFGASQGQVLFLEERQFTVTHSLMGTGLVELFEPLVPHSETRDRLSDQLVVLPNEDFAWFAQYGLSVNARNVLDNDTKESKNLWYEETLPADSLFYSVFGERNLDGNNGPIDEAQRLLNTYDRYIQVGGNQTVGQGWFAVQWLDEGGQ